MGLLLATGFAWCAEPFPPIRSDNLLGQKISFPEAAHGRPAVVVLGFTHASQAQTKAWSAKLTPEFQTYSLAVIQAVPRLVRGMAIHGIKSETPENQRAHFLLVLHDEKELKQAVGFDAPNDAYLALLDADGVIEWHYHGPLTDSALAELKSRVAALAGGQ